MEFYTVALQKHWNYLNKLKDKSLIDIRISNRKTSYIKNVTISMPAEYVLSYLRTSPLLHGYL